MPVASEADADLRQVEGSHIESLDQGVCQVTQTGHLAVLPQLGLGEALPLPLCQPQGGQVHHHMLLLMDATPVPAMIRIPMSLETWQCCRTHVFLLGVPPLLLFVMCISTVEVTMYLMWDGCFDICGRHRYEVPECLKLWVPY